MSVVALVRAPRRIRRVSAAFGPAFVAAVAYVDPGNVVTNMQGGARYGYRLLWVVVAAGLMAMPVQYLSAKLGIATGRDLARVCGERYSRGVARLLWVQAELVAIATDLAEFVGAAIGMNLLFGVPPPVAALVTAVVAFGLTALQARGYRRYELAIIGLLAIVVVGFLYETVRSGPDVRGAAYGLVPSFAGHDSVLLAVGIVGATVMPHVVYLHSALTAERTGGRADRRRLLRGERYDVLIALGVAGVVNAAMLAIAARLFHGTGYAGVATIDEMYRGIGRVAGGGAALTFAVVLLASGLSSSSVGTYAGQVVMSGFVGLRIPSAARRLITMLPAVVVLTTGFDPARALVLSQVLLSFGIPFAVIPLLMITRDRRVMGEYVNRPVTTLAAGVIVGVIVALNAYLLYAELG